MEKKLRKIYFISYNLFISQDLLQAHCQGLSIIFLMEFIKLNVNTDTMIKNVRIKYKYCDRFLKYTSFKGCLKEYRCIFCNKSYQQVG